MDEVIFRSSQKIENLQIQLSLASEQGRALLQQFSIYAHSVLSQLRKSNFSVHFEETIHQLWQGVLELAGKLQKVAHTHSLRLIDTVQGLFTFRWSKENICIGCIGFLLGILCGVGIGLAVKRRDVIKRYMRSVQCFNYTGIEAVSVVEDTSVPKECGCNDVLIDVKAASVNIIDAQICEGYGLRLRSILNNHIFKPYLPVTLGRDCSGIVTDVGKDVNRFEVGDEVWLKVPFWARGTLSQTIKVSQNHVFSKPKTIGYEAASSLPYSGTIALSALQNCRLTSNTCRDKRILIIGGCTPVGCVLVQLLNKWKASVTTTCMKKAVPVCMALGSHDVICLQNDEVDGEDISEIRKLIIKELELRENYDFIFVTIDYEFSNSDLQQFYNENGRIFSTLPLDLCSDSFGSFSSLLFWIWLSCKNVVQKITNKSVNEPRIDQLKEFVESCQLQTVVDKVYHPTDIITALKHIQSPDSIGSTIITFR